MYNKLYSENSNANTRDGQPEFTMEDLGCTVTERVHGDEANESMDALDRVYGKVEIDPISELAQTLKEAGKSQAEIHKIITGCINEIVECQNAALANYLADYFNMNVTEEEFSQPGNGPKF